MNLGSFPLNYWIFTICHIHWQQIPKVYQSFYEKSRPRFATTGSYLFNLPLNTSISRENEPAVLSNYLCTIYNFGNICNVSLLLFAVPFEDCLKKCL